MKNKVMQFVEKICNMESVGCRSLNKSSLARELMDMANIPQNADIQEIPLDWNNQVVILFLLPNDKNYYSLFAGIGTDGKFYFQLSITRKNPCSDKFYFLDEDEILPIDFFTKKMSITNQIMNFIKTVAKVAVIESPDMTIKQCTEEYTSQILENDYYGVVNWANWKGIQVPDELRWIIDPEF